MTPQPPIDLTHSILYHAFKNFLALQWHEVLPYSIDAIATKLSADYGLDIRTVLREINRLKREGYIYFIERPPDKDKVRTCVEAKKKSHPKTPEERLAEKCKQILGYTVYPVLTEGGLYEYCELVARNFKNDREAIEYVLKNNPDLYICKERGVWVL